MKKKTKSPFLEEIEMDLDEIMNSNLFGDNEGDEIQLSTLGTVRKPAKKGMRKQNLSNSQRQQHHQS